MADLSFDYVIVGAGSAGCVLANRLSEDGGASVLLLEAGGRDTNPLIHIPLGMGKMHQYQMHDWGYETEPVPNLDNRKLEAMRGKVLGGSSAINVMAYTRGHPKDFDRWAAMGAKGWSYNDVLPYFRRCETFEGEANAAGKESQYRGSHGPLGTQFARTTDPLFTAWKDAGSEKGYPVNDDYNAAEQEGFGTGQYTIRDGYRSSTSRAFLRPARNRPNLTVITGAHTNRILMNGTTARGIEYVKDSQTHTALATRETILCAGAFNSPQVLMLSGIGPADHLRDMRINCIADLPVGKHLQDHLGIWITYARKEPGTFHREMRFDRMAVSMLRAYFLGQGPGTVVPGGLHAFVKTDPSLDVPDIEFMFHTVPPATRLWFPGIVSPYKDGYGIRPTLLHPHSRGEILLRSSDPQDHPRILFNFFSDPRDLPKLREGFRRAREVGEAAAMAPYREKEVSPGPDCRSDDEIDAYIRRTALTAHHPASTCKMGSDDSCVVDPECRVHGIENLRVVDASIMPDLVSAHLNAATIMIADKASDIIRAAH
ncbi:MAG: GMC family oxidoreductase N-terminal domain-containing protein [Hyphomicrobiales bacterium]|nr:GMC family oxidoreductase N-terminal domain-containing protein [Hyphomicrobiales bacterium]